MLPVFRKRKPSPIVAIYNHHKPFLFTCTMNKAAAPTIASVTIIVSTIIRALCYGLEGSDLLEQFFDLVTHSVGVV